MGSRVRENPECLFEFFLELHKAEYGDLSVVRQYPEEYHDAGLLLEIPKLAFPCDIECSQIEHFSFVVPDVAGMFRFGFCRMNSEHNTCLCIVSWLPWFETFYKMLDTVSLLLSQTNTASQIREFLQQVIEQDVPAPHMPVQVIAGDMMFNFTATDPNLLPRIPGSINLTEYFNALDTNNMMIVFASMLHERRIYMTSRRLSRLTSCIFAAEALLYPLSWQHTLIPVLPGHIIECLGLMTPYVIGVHRSLLNKVDDIQEELLDTVFVDLDNNKVITETNDLANLPTPVVSALKKDLKSDKLKASAQKGGDALSMAFLKALVRLIGGYREALKLRPDEPMVFDEESFVESRSSQGYSKFLRGLLSLQMFNEFIQDKMDDLNCGAVNKGIFDEHAALYNEKHRKDKHKFKDMRVKFKAQGRRAISTVMSGLTDTDSGKISKSHSSSKRSSKHSTVPSQSESLSATLDTPPEPKCDVNEDEPPEAVTIEVTKQDELDGEEPFNFRQMDMDLLCDTDIQSVLNRSPSSEIINQIAGREGDTTAENNSDIGLVTRGRKSSVASSSSSSSYAGEGDNQPETSAGAQNKSKGDKLIRPIKRSAPKPPPKKTVSFSSLTKLLVKGRRQSKPRTVSTISLIIGGHSSLSDNESELQNQANVDQSVTSDRRADTSSNQIENRDKSDTSDIQKAFLLDGDKMNDLLFDEPNIQRDLFTGQSTNHDRSTTNPSTCSTDVHSLIDFSVPEETNFDPLKCFKDQHIEHDNRQSAVSSGLSNLESLTGFTHSTDGYNKTGKGEMTNKSLPFNNSLFPSPNSFVSSASNSTSVRQKHLLPQWPSNLNTPPLRIISPSSAQGLLDDDANNVLQASLLPMSSAAADISDKNISNQIQGFGPATFGANSNPGNQADLFNDLIDIDFGKMSDNKDES